MQTGEKRPVILMNVDNYLIYVYKASMVGAKNWYKGGRWNYLDGRWNYLLTSVIALQSRTGIFIPVHYKTEITISVFHVHIQHPP